MPLAILGALLVRNPLPLAAGGAAAALLAFWAGRRARDARLRRGGGIALAAGTLVLVGAVAVAIDPMFVLFLLPLSAIGLAYWLVLVPAFLGGLLYALARGTALALRPEARA